MNNLTFFGECCEIYRRIHHNADGCRRATKDNNEISKNMLSKEEELMEKIQISKEESIAIESALEVNGGDKASVVHWHAQNLWDGERYCLNDLDLDAVCTALYVGYEIEPGPAEKVLQFYEVNAKNKHIEFAVRHTLNLLDVQIKGINF